VTRQRAELCCKVQFTAIYQILTVLSVTLFEKTPILRALQASDSERDLPDAGNQLILFDF